MFASAPNWHLDTEDRLQAKTGLKNAHKTLLGEFCTWPEDLNVLAFESSGPSLDAEDRL